LHPTGRIQARHVKVVKEILMFIIAEDCNSFLPGGTEDDSARRGRRKKGGIFASRHSKLSNNMWAGKI
jgi:hypothetical protein